MRPSYISIAEPLVSEEEAKAAYEAIREVKLRYGGNVKAFENTVARYVGVKYAVAVSSGTAALHTSLLALGLGSNDEVLQPSFSCAPPLIATLLVGAKPVFADIESETYNVDPVDVERKMTPRTRVIIPIHYAGHPADLDRLMEIAEDHSLVLLEDAAEAFGALFRGRKVGSFGDLSILSFSPNKIITTGEGGMVLTSNHEIAERARIARDYGQKGRFNYVMLGNNYHMTEMQGAIGLVQMRKIDYMLRRRKEVAHLLTQKLAVLNGVRPPIERPHVEHAFMAYSIRVDREKFGVSRDQLREILEHNGVQTRIYFPPLHVQPYFRQLVGKLHLPNTSRIADEILTLPLYPKMSPEDVEYIVNIMKEHGPPLEIALSRSD